MNLLSVEIDKLIHVSQALELRSVREVVAVQSHPGHPAPRALSATRPACGNEASRAAGLALAVLDAWRGRGRPTPLRRNRSKRWDEIGMVRAT
jgi:hypothetical protein